MWRLLNSGPKGYTTTTAASAEEEDPTEFDDNNGGFGRGYTTPQRNQRRRQRWQRIDGWTYGLVRTTEGSAEEGNPKNLATTIDELTEENKSVERHYMGVFITYTRVEN